MVGLTVVVSLFGESLPWLWGVWVSASILPAVAVAVAISRHHLYDIDRLVSRTIAYSLVTVILVTVFGGLVLVLQAALAEVTDGDTVIVAASTLIVATLFAPLRRRVQTLVDQRFDRSAYDAARTVEAYAGRLRDELDLVTLTGDLRNGRRDRRAPDGDRRMASTEAAAMIRSRDIAGRVGLALLVLSGGALASFDVITLAQYLPYAIVGGVLVARRPRNPIAWLLIAIAFAFIGTSVPADLDLAALQAGTASIRDFLHVWVGAWASTLLFTLFAAMACLFPTGRLPTGRARAWILTVLGLGLASAFSSAFVGSTLTASLPSIDGQSVDIVVPNRYAIASMAGAPSLPDELPGTLVIFALLLTAAASTIARYRSGTDVERLQLRWFMTAVVSLGLAILIGLIGSISLGSDTVLIWIPTLLAYFAVPVAIGSAVQRYRLFEIDRLLSRTIAYTLITAILFVVFAVVNLSLQSTLGSFARGNAIGVAVSTLVVAALFQPLRVRLQRVVDRRFNRVRQSHEQVIARFAAGLRDETDVERVLDAMRRAAEETVEPTVAAVWQRDRRATT